jgi:signal transduction histidine kinase/ActR/RegA family two-component response regulator
MPLSIRSRLLLLVLSVLLPAVLAASWVLVRAYEAEREAVDRHLRDTARALAMVVDRELVQRAAIARVLALSNTLDGPLDEQALVVFRHKAERAMEGLAGWVDLQGPQGLLTSTRTAQPAGRGEATLPPLVDRASIGMLEDVKGGVPHAAAVQPVQRDGGALLNVRVTILPSELQHIVDAQRLPEGWIGAVMDGRGVIIARQPGGAARVGANASEEIRRLLREADESLFEATSIDGAPIKGYFSKSPQGWAYVSAMPRQPFTMPQALAQLVTGSLLLLTAAVVGALWMARRIEGPVRRLQAAADALRAREPVEPMATGVAEVDAVSAALADAAVAVRRNEAELQHQVAQAVAQTRATEQQAARGQRSAALGRLTGGVAHDFNNLLGVISNSAHLMQRHADTDALRVPLAAVLRAVDTGSRLTQHLLRIAGRHPARPGRLSLQRFMPEAAELMKVVLGRRIEVSAEVAPGTHEVNVDPSELELALINLATNARDALQGKGNGRVWVQAYDAGPEDLAGLTGLAPGTWVAISVSDDGAGMPEAMVERAFEPFFTTKAVGKGTGLGLSQVQGFCEQAGGRARLASTPGVGTSVTLLLPAADAPQDGADDEQPAPGTAAQEGQLAGKRVLLVEDNEELASVTAVLLAGFGCSVEPARSAEHALRLFDGGHRFDVVLSDIVMPGELDGLGLARRLRQRFPGLPIVLISGYSSALAEVRDFPVLRKPCPPERLTAALAEAMAGGGAQPAARASAQNGSQDAAPGGTVQPAAPKADQDDPRDDGPRP